MHLGERGAGGGRLGATGAPAARECVDAHRETAAARRQRTDGRDLRKINSGRWRKRLLVEHPLKGWALIRERNKVLFNIDSDREGDEFYVLCNDPYQTHSLHNDRAYASQMADLASKLSRMRNAGGDKLRAMEQA